MSDRLISEHAALMAIDNVLWCAPAFLAAVTAYIEALPEPDEATALRSDLAAAREFVEDCAQEAHDGRGMTNRCRTCRALVLMERWKR